MRFCLRLKSLALLLTVSSAFGDPVDPQYCPTLLKSVFDASDGRIGLVKKSSEKITNYSSFVVSRYGNKLGTQFLSLVDSKLGAQFRPLLADPGIAFHIEEFSNFIEKNPKATQLDVWQLRDLFSASLGRKTVYRSLVLTQEQAEGILKSGMDARYLRPQEGRSIKYDQVDPFSHNIFSMMKERVTTIEAPILPAIDGLLSVTNKKSAGEEVASWFLDESRPDLKVFTFKLDVPKMDLLPAPGDDGNIESFMLFRVTPEEILEVSAEGFHKTSPKNYQAAALGRQNLFRGLDHYAAFLPKDFPEIIRQGRMSDSFHWIDSGGGMGAAGIESFYGTPVDRFYWNGSRLQTVSGFARSWPLSGRHSVTVISKEDVITATLKNPAVTQGTVLQNKKIFGHLFDSIEQRKLQIRKKMYDDVRKSNRFKYLSGRYLEEIPAAELGKGDLITDFYGVFSYTPNKLSVLLQYSNLLKDHGVALVMFNRDRIFVQAGEEKIDFASFLKAQGIKGIEVDETYRRKTTIRMRKISKAEARRLMDLESHLGSPVVEESYEPPPTYTFTFN